MRAMILGFCAIVIIGFAAPMVLGQLGFSSAETNSGDNVRLNP